MSKHELEILEDFYYSFFTGKISKHEYLKIQGKTAKCSQELASGVPRIGTGFSHGRSSGAYGHSMSRATPNFSGFKPV